MSSYMQNDHCPRCNTINWTYKGAFTLFLLRFTGEVRLPEFGVKFLLSKIQKPANHGFSSKTHLTPCLLGVAVTCFAGGIFSSADSSCTCRPFLGSNASQNIFKTADQILPLITGISLRSSCLSTWRLSGPFLDLRQWFRRAIIGLSYRYRPFYDQKPATYSCRLSVPVACSSSSELLLSPKFISIKAGRHRHKILPMLSLFSLVPISLLFLLLIFWIFLTTIGLLHSLFPSIRPLHLPVLRNVDSNPVINIPELFIQILPTGRLDFFQLVFIEPIKPLCKLIEQLFVSCILKRTLLRKK